MRPSRCRTGDVAVKRNPVLRIGSLKRDGIPCFHAPAPWLPLARWHDRAQPTR
jgi:hypothetical protein